MQTLTVPTGSPAERAYRLLVDKDLEDWAPSRLGDVDPSNPCTSVKEYCQEWVQALDESIAQFLHDTRSLAPPAVAADVDHQLRTDLATWEQLAAAILSSYEDAGAKGTSIQEMLDLNRRIGPEVDADG